MPSDILNTGLDTLRTVLERAVLIRQYDRIDEDNTYGVTVSVERVINRSANEINQIEHFYNGDCMRITFNEDENDFVDAYFTLDVAQAATAGLVHKISRPKSRTFTK